MVALAFALAGCAGTPSTGGDSGTRAARSTQQQAFPDAWIGRWTGPISTLGGASAQVIQMTLEIAPLQEPGRWSWTIIYEGDGQRQVRPYELVAVDPAAGSYEIDEKSGIVIPVRFLDGTIYSTFEVMGSRIELRESMQHDRTGAPEIAVEMATIAADAAVTTGGVEARAVPEVRCWTPRVVQRGRLLPK